MEKFTFTNSKGDSLVIGTHQDAYLLAAHTGTTSAEVLTTARKGYDQNGQFYVKTNLGTRIITLEFYIRRKKDVAFYQAKRDLSAIFNPLLGEGTLTYENDYIKKQITVAVTGMPEITEKNKILGKYTVELTAHNPFWEDIAETSIMLASFVGGLSFPITFTGSGVIFATKGMRATIRIESDVDTPITAEFCGACVNPVFRKTSTGQEIAINTSIVDGEKIIVTTGYGNKNVVKVSSRGVRTNVNNLVTDDSEFFSLTPGENGLSFDADAGTPEIYLYYRNLYTGV